MKKKKLTETQEKHLALWNELKEKFGKTLQINMHKTNERNYYRLPSKNRKGIHFEWMFEEKENKFGVELHFEHIKNPERNQYNLNILKPYLPELERRIGQKAIVEEDWKSRHWSRIYFKIDQVETDDTLKLFALSTMTELYNYFMPVIEKEKANLS
jgi:hypothetical protein